MWLCESKLLPGWYKMNKAFARAIAVHQLSEIVWFCSSKEIPSIKAAAFRITTWLTLWKSSTTVQNPTTMWTGQVNTFASLKIFMVTLIYTDLLRDAVLLLIWYSGWAGQLQWFPFGPSCCISPRSTGQGANGKSLLVCKSVLRTTNSGKIQVQRELL